MIQYVLFDLDGTITDPAEGITKSVQYALESVGHPEPDRKKLLSFIGPPLRVQFAAWCGFDPEREADKIEFCVEKYRERFGVKGLFENEEYPGVRECLAGLKQMGKTVCLATSKPTAYAEQILDHFCLDVYFDDIVGATMDGSRDTKAEVIAETLRRLSLSEDVRDEVVMVGDRMHDIDGAKEFGLKTVGVTYGYGTREELLSHGADVVVDNVRELTELLLRGDI